jgi:hypothetical protein
MSPYEIIPSSESKAFMLLTEEQRQDVLFWAGIVIEADAAKSKNAAFAEIAKRFPGVKGVSVSTIRRKYYDWKRDGWQTLINRSTLKSDQKVKALGDAPRGQSPEFIEFWKMLQENNQRGCKAAYRDLVRRYRRGEQIPGVGTWRTVWMDKLGGIPPKQCPLNAPLPDGWGGNGRNLMRYKPNKVELVFVRQGLGKARNFLPKVYTTRVGMDVGMIYVFDDMWHNILVNAPGNSKAMRPLEFACQDVFSAARVAWGIQPMRENPDTGKREMLRETEMRFLLCHVLCNLGYNPAGCRLHVEHGTAAIRKDLEEFLSTISDGAITVARGGIHNSPAFDGSFAPQPRGNSRFKGSLESQHALAQTEVAHLPGQVGKDRDHAPEELYGLQMYNTKLLKKAGELPPERAALLDWPVLNIDQFRSVVAEAYQNMNLRRDHKLEGFREAELVTNEFRLSPASAWEPMRNLELMDPEDRQLASALIQRRPDELSRCEQMSPAEVFASRQNKLVKLPPVYAPQILGRRNAKPYRLDRDQQLSFENRRLGPGTFRFDSQVVTESGELVDLQPDTTYLVYATPFDTSAVFVCDEDNRFIGISNAIQTPCKLDDEAIHRRMGKAAAAETRLLSGAKARRRPQAEKKTNMHERNAAVFNGDPITDQELAVAARVKAERGGLQDVFSHPNPTDLDDYETEESGDLSDIF